MRFKLFSTPFVNSVFSIVIAFLLVFGSPISLYAQGTWDYLVQDGGKRASGNPYWQTHPTEPIPWRWSQYRFLSPWSNNVEKLKYAFHTGVDTNTKNIFENVKNHYQNQLNIPWLKFQSSPSAASSADVVIDTNGQCGTWIPACVYSNYRKKDNIRKSSYRQSYVLSLNYGLLDTSPTNFLNPVIWDNDAIQAVFAHEVGHIFGLHEQYVAGCTPVTSIMDAGEIIAGYLEHCDNITLPNIGDLNRIKDYYFTSSLNYYIKEGIQDVSGQIEHKWIDNSWSENLAYFWIYEYTGTPPSWQQGTPDSRSGDDIGMRHTTVFRELDFLINPSSHGIPTGRWVIICGYPVLGHQWYWGSGSNNPVVSNWYTGSWRCSDAEWW